MTSFLFRASTAPEFPRPRKTYGSMYRDLVRASSDAVDALSLYRTLILAKDTSADGVGFAAFDAHVGDTSCQLRAAMMLDLTRQHRKWAASSGCAPWLDQYIERLEVLRNKGRDMLAKLTIDRIHPDKLGIGPKEDTPTGLLTHMGWCEPEIPRHPDSFYLRSSTPTKAFNDALVLDEKNWDTPLSDEDCVAAWTLTEKPLASSPAQYAWWQIDNNSMHRISPMASCTSLSGETLAEEAETPPEGSPDKYLSPLLDEQDTAMAWDPWNAKMLVRFITFSFVLSKYKAFHRFKHAVGTRLSPEAAINAGDEMVHDVWKKRPLDDYLYSKSPRRIYIEFGVMQTWISELSCAWLCHTAKTSSAAPGLQQLMTRTLQTSVKNVTSIPAYVGYIAIREHCGKERESLIFVDRHFCKKGHHSNFFLATLDLESANSGDENGRPKQCLPLKQDVSWTVKRIDKAWLLNHPEQDRVHFIVMGNSIDGSYEDYMNAARTQQKHIDEPCDENENHVAKFLAGDLDRLSLAFFARHRHYTFDLNSVGDDDEIPYERTVVSEHMENIFPELADQWCMSNEEADDIGVAGTSLYMFAWQHAFVETKGRIAALISEATHTMPISAPLEKLPGWERRAYM